MTSGNLLLGRDMAYIVDPDLLLNRSDLGRSEGDLGANPLLLWHLGLLFDRDEIEGV
jgi:hypothetical protein